MGCCSSQEADDHRNDETRPLLEPRQSTTPVDTTDGYRRRAVSSHVSQNDEQAALSRILHQTANNVIDVSAIEPHGVEQHEYRDRQRQYSSRVLTVSTGLRAAQGNAVQLPPGQAAPVEALAAMPVSSSDVRLVQSMSLAAASAVGKINIQHTEPLVVQLS